MKKVPRQKLALTAETIRSLTPANLGAVAGGAIVVLTTTSTSHSIYTNCAPTTTISSVVNGSSIYEQP